MNAFLYNTGHLLNSVKSATINLKIKRKHCNKQNSYNIKSSHFMDTTVFQENCHISFLSLDEHFASCYTKSDFSTLTHHQ